MYQKPSGGTRWWSLSAPPDPLAVLWGLGPPGRDGMGREKKGENERGRGREMK